MSNRLQLYSDLLQSGFRVIDKADLRVPQNVPFTRQFQKIYDASVRAKNSPWKSSDLFVSTADMREYGYDVRLHLCSTKTKKPIHKVEIYDTGGKSFNEMHRLPASIFECDPNLLGLMRVDLCADIHGVDVGYFKRHTLIKHKQTHREFGVVLPYQTIRKGKAETLYAGVKPLQYRVYNKSQERLVRWRWMARQLRRQFPAMEPISYEALYGHSENEIITRVERQAAGRDLQKLELLTFGDLQKTPFLDPFKSVVFLEADHGEPSMEEHGFSRWTAGMYLRHMVEEDGLAATRGWMKEKLGRNVYREWKIYESFLHIPDYSPCIDSAGLLKAYKESVIAQIGLPDRRLIDAGIRYLHPSLKP
jgi:hypothetical protein